MPFWQGMKTERIDTDVPPDGPSVLRVSRAELLKRYDPPVAEGGEVPVEPGKCGVCTAPSASPPLSGHFGAQIAGRLENAKP